MDEVGEVVDSLDASVEDATPAGFLDAVKEAEVTLQSALQLFPESSEILATEATFRDQLNQTSRAHEALERAFNLNPRQDWLAVRLARRYVSMGDTENGRRVLESCLRDNPGSKIVHLEIGRILASTGEPGGALEHFRRSFTEGDNYFEGQFWCARELFLQGKFEESKRLFAGIHRQSSWSVSHSEWLTGRERRHCDLIRRPGKEEGRRLRLYSIGAICARCVCIQSRKRGDRMGCIVFRNARKVWSRF